MSLDAVNKTMNGTQPWSCKQIYDAAATKIGVTFVYCLIFVVSLAGNTFIAMVVFKTNTMRKPINVLIANMAMSDLLFPICLFPRIVTRLYVDSWLVSGRLGEALCKLLTFLTDVSGAVSIQSLVLIAVDRFQAVVFPLRSPLISSKRCPFFILATWMVGIATSTAYLFAYKLVKNQGRLVCELRWKEAFGESSSFANYILPMTFVFFYIPLLVIAILYRLIYLKLKTQVIPGEQTAIAIQQRLTRERNVLKIAIAILLGFALCWLPYSFASTALFVFGGTQQCGFVYFTFVAAVIAHSNCAINPSICFIFSQNYRQGLKNFLTRS